MSTKTRIGNGERLGHWLGGMWRTYARGEKRVTGMLVAHGWSTGLAKTLLRAAKLALLVVLFYVAFWVVVVLVLAVMCLWMIVHADLEPDEDQPEWREGHSGWGLYDKSEWRHDPGGPDDP